MQVAAAGKSGVFTCEGFQRSELVPSAAADVHGEEKVLARATSGSQAKVLVPDSVPGCAIDTHFLRADRNFQQGSSGFKSQRLRQPPQVVPLQSKPTVQLNF